MPAKVIPSPANAGLTWRRASRCASNGCVEIAFSGDSIVVRDSKRPDSPVLTYSSEEWASFIDGVKNGEFDLH